MFAPRGTMSKEHNTKSWKNKVITQENGDVRVNGWKNNLSEWTKSLVLAKLLKSIWWIKVMKSLEDLD